MVRTPAQPASLAQDSSRASQDQPTIADDSRRPPTEAPQTDAFVEVDEITLNRQVQRIFTGWMFATSPGLHGVEHPIYDVWLTDCKSPEVSVAAQPDPAPTPAPAAARPAPRRPAPQTPQGIIPRR